MMIGVCMTVLMVGSLAACSETKKAVQDTNIDNGEYGNIIGDGQAHSFKTFSVIVPANWATMDQSEVSYTDGGIEQVDKAGVILDKNPDDEDDNCMNDIEIRRYDKNADPKAKSRNLMYQKMKSLPDIQINGVTCKCYEGEWYDEDADTSDPATPVDSISQYITYTTDKGVYDICITKMVDKQETGLSLENEEVLTILNSIQDINQ